MAKSPQLTDFLLRFQHAVAEPPANRACTCALTIAVSYFAGGFLPMLPYFFVGKGDIGRALWASVGVMAVVLGVFGYVKTCFESGWRGARAVRRGLVGGTTMVVVGGVAAGSAMALVRAFQAFADS